jgi:DNA transformation protein
MNSAPKRLRDMKNIGATFEQALVRVGIETPQQLQTTDPFDVYTRLKRSVPGTSLVALYAVFGALEDRHWLEVKRDRRTEILLRLDDMGMAPK